MIEAQSDRFCKINQEGFGEEGVKAIGLDPFLSQLSWGRFQNKKEYIDSV